MEAEGGGDRYTYEAGHLSNRDTHSCTHTYTHTLQNCRKMEDRCTKACRGGLSETKVRFTAASPGITADKLQKTRTLPHEHCTGSRVPEGVQGTPQRRSTLGSRGTRCKELLVVACDSLKWKLMSVLAQAPSAVPLCQSPSPVRACGI